MLFLYGTLCGFFIICLNWQKSACIPTDRYPINESMKHNPLLDSFSKMIKNSSLLNLKPGAKAEIIPFTWIKVSLQKKTILYLEKGFTYGIIRRGWWIWCIYQNHKLQFLTVDLQFGYLWSWTSRYELGLSVITRGVLLFILWIYWIFLFHFFAWCVLSIIIYFFGIITFLSRTNKEAEIWIYFVY